MEAREVIPDIYNLVGRQDGWFDDTLAKSLAQSVSSRLKTHFNAAEKEGRLRLSKMGPSCPKALWCSVHHPEFAAPLPPWSKIKYSYGHILEALAITLARAAGHSVEGEQDELDVDGVKGHRDLVLDGLTVDVKSISSLGFQDLKKGNFAFLNTWGYLAQLDAYVVGALHDPLVKVKDKGGLLFIDLQKGHLFFYEHKVRHDYIRERVREAKQIADVREAPECRCGTVADGKSGNIILDTRASYNSYRYFCNPGLRTFIYSSGPRYFTKVVRTPREAVLEVDQYGKRVYN